MIDVKAEAVKMIARMRANGHTEAADHAEQVVMPLLREQRAGDDDTYHEMTTAIVGLTLAFIEAKNGDPFDLATLCFSITMLCMKHVHETTEVNAICLMRSIGQSLVDAADGIEAMGEEEDGETEAG
jgi:hypothetical protein